MANVNNATLIDFIGDYIQGTFNVRPSMLDNIASKVKLAVIELQKENMLPETTIEFISLDMKDEKRDASGELIYNFYELPLDFWMLYNKGPAFEVDDSDKKYNYLDYGDFIRTFNSTKRFIFSLHKFNGEYGIRNRLIVKPFPEDTDVVRITYYSNGQDTKIADIDETYYMPVLNYVLAQIGIKPKQAFIDDLNNIKTNRNSPAGQGSFHNSFARSRARFFGSHRRDLKRRS